MGTPSLFFPFLKFFFHLFVRLFVYMFLLRQVNKGIFIFLLKNSTRQYLFMLDNWLLPNSWSNLIPLWLSEAFLCVPEELDSSGAQRRSRSKYCVGVVCLSVPDLVSNVGGPLGGCESLSPPGQRRMRSSLHLHLPFWEDLLCPYTVLDAWHVLSY